MNQAGFEDPQERTNLNPTKEGTAGSSTAPEQRHTPRICTDHDVHAIYDVDCFRCPVDNRPVSTPRRQVDSSGHPTEQWTNPTTGGLRRAMSIPQSSSRS